MQNEIRHRPAFHIRRFLNQPFLIGVGVAMPLSLTILGVFGGFVAFGFLGLFIGPTLIAVAFTLLEAWRGAPAATLADKT